MILAMTCLLRCSIAVVLATLSLSACGDDSSAEGSTTTASSTTASSGAEGTTTAPDTGNPTGVSEGTTSTSTGPSTLSVGESTTGEVALCNGWSDRGPDTPWLELYDAYLEPLASGGPFPLVCGGQGSWMLPIFPHMGGWELADPSLTFSVEVVVEGFPGPFGSFYDEPRYYYDLECFNGGDTFDGGFSHDCIAVLPPDTIPDLGALDGAPATIHVELAVDGGSPLVMDLVDMTVSAPPDVIASGCLF